jgi:hypothetical protein
VNVASAFVDIWLEGDIFDSVFEIFIFGFDSKSTNKELSIPLSDELPLGACSSGAYLGE